MRFVGFAAASGLALGCALGYLISARSPSAPAPPPLAEAVAVSPPPGVDQVESAPRLPRSWEPVSVKGFERYRLEFQVRRRWAERAFRRDRESESAPFAGLSFEDDRYPTAHRPDAFLAMVDGLERALANGLDGRRVTIREADCSAVPCTLRVTAEASATELADNGNGRPPVADEVFDWLAAASGLGSSATSSSVGVDGSLELGLWWQPYDRSRHPYLAKQVADAAWARLKDPAADAARLRRMLEGSGLSAEQIEEALEGLEDLQ